MSYEADLAQLLIRMGAERGVDVETILSELSWVQFPSFVDGAAVRESLIDAVESWWRADLEDRINQLRNQFNDAAGQQMVGAPPAYQATPEPASAFTAPEAVQREEVSPEVQTPITSEMAPANETQPPLQPTPTPESAPAVEEPAIEGEAANKAPDALPSDATMIWNTRGG